MRGTLKVAAGATLVSAGVAMGAELVVESVPAAAFDVPGIPTVDTVSFTAAQPITGVGLSGLWSAVAGDFVDGVYPWSLDLTATVEAPGGETFQWGPGFFGDVTIAPYPVQDGSGPSLSGAAGPGTYTFTWRNDPQGPGGISRVDEPVYHATTTVPDVVFTFDAEPDPATSWSRPFFIDGVSSLGPVSYHVLEFEVPASGVYELESVRDDGGDHFTFLYQGSFDDQQPLAALNDYGLGNGNSPFGVPRGTSRFPQLLFEGVRYYWVSSQWASFRPLGSFTNTITGPARPVVFAGATCAGDVDGDLDCDVFDFAEQAANFGAGPGATREQGDLTGDGFVDVFDFGELSADFGCDLGP
jgi:hypothetical protein